MAPLYVGGKRNEVKKRRYLGTGHVDAAPLPFAQVIRLTSSVHMQQAFTSMPCLTALTRPGLSTPALHCFSLYVHKIPSLSYVLFDCHLAVLAALYASLTNDHIEVGFGTKKAQKGISNAHDHPKESAGRCARESRVLTSR